MVIVFLHPDIFSLLSYKNYSFALNPANIHVVLNHLNHKFSTKAFFS